MYEYCLYRSHAHSCYISFLSHSVPEVKFNESLSCKNTVRHNELKPKNVSTCVLVLWWRNKGMILIGRRLTTADWQEVYSMAGGYLEILTSGPHQLSTQKVTVMLCTSFVSDMHIIMGAWLVLQIIINLQWMSNSGYLSWYFYKLSLCTIYKRAFISIHTVLGAHLEYSFCWMQSNLRLLSIPLSL